jgi:two-component system LytT family response regulator
MDMLETMPQLTTLIVDDELQSRLLLKTLLLKNFPQFTVEEAESVNTAKEKIASLRPDLVFLDVQMRDETGFDLLDQLGTINFGIIFTTAHSEYALKAFRYSAIDYLMKPIDSEEFTSAVSKALLQIKNQQSSSEQIEFLKEVRSNKTSPDKLTIPTSEGFLFVNIKDILYCHAVGNYTEFHIGSQQKIVSSYTLGYYDEILSSHQFFRVHRSHLVNLVHIKMYKRGEGGSIIMNDGQEIEISRNHKEAFLKLFKI